MPWFKVDDNLAMHAKVVAAGNAALGLWVRAGSWCSQQLTDGFVPSYIVPVLGTKAQAEALVRAGLWGRVEGGFTFWQWTDRQPTREAVEADREAARERQRQRRSRRTSGDVRRDTDRTSEVVTGGVRDPRPDPTRPDPTRVPSEHPGESEGGPSPSVTREAPPAPPTPPDDARSRAHRQPVPGDRCPRHVGDPSPPPCGACGDARRRHDAAVQARREVGPVVGGLECPQHPGRGAGNCPDCARTAVPMPDGVRDELRRRRQRAS